ncbi:MAG: glycosyltransferase N-terminal domain-containing protein [Simkaniaceae bacterium]|nr:glycosyltransferase N-terminal domain-containing protein [Candidatus Sacchlamyda saccharinae]
MLYNLILILGAIAQIPKWLLQKKYHGTILQRLGFSLPAKANTIPTIWIHAVSMGETSAILPIYKRLREKYPTAAFYFSSMTKTGLARAQKLYPEAAGYFYLPLDFSWVMKRLVLRLKPDILVLSEGDFWHNLIRNVKSRGGKVLLLNGKISLRSSNRFAKVPRFSKRLFKQIDHLCIQNTEYATRFRSLYIPPERISITGNLKLSIEAPKLDPKEKAKWREKFGFKETDRVITIGSTHEREEELILPQISGFKILLAPRHPERFAAIRKFLEKNPYPHVHLVDQMGLLNICFQLSDLAIIGGSFLPGVGGHNIFEPIQAEIPVLFGPYMETQNELVELILNANAGIQTPAENLSIALSQAFSLTENAKLLSKHGTKIADETWKAVETNLS